MGSWPTVTVHRACSCFLTHTPSERVVLEIKCAHSVPWLACSLKALDAVHSLPFGAWRFCTRLHPQKTGKISDSTRENAMSSSGSSLPPLTRIFELGHFRPRPPALQDSCWRCLGTDSSFGGNTWRYRPLVAGSRWHEYACAAVGEVPRPQIQSIYE